MIKRVMKAGTAARSAGYRASYLDRAMTEDSSFSTVHRFVIMAALGYIGGSIGVLGCDGVLHFCISAVPGFFSIFMSFFWRENASPRSSASTPTSPTCAKISSDSVSGFA